MTTQPSDHDGYQRAQIQLAAERRILAMVAAGQPAPVVLDALCGFVEQELAADCRCGIYEVDPHRPRLRVASAPSLPASLNDALCALPLQTDAGPCAGSVCLNAPVIANDLQTAPQWQVSAFGALARSHGIGSCWATPVRSRAGEILGTAAVFQRVSVRPAAEQQDLLASIANIASIAIERARGQDAARRREAFLLESERLGSTGSFSWSVPADEMVWSEQLYRIFEFDAAVPVTTALIESRVHPDDLGPARAMRARARLQANDIDFAFRLQLPEGRVKHLRLVARATGRPEADLEYAGAVQDITAQHAAGDALNRAQSELARVSRALTLGALAVSIAHDVNQALSGIITNASTCMRLLSDDSPDIDRARETARRTLRDGNRVSEVVGRLRALFGRKDARVESVDLNAAAREVLALSLGTLQRGRVVVRTALADDLPPVTGDRVQLQQVILNLVLNAADAMATVEGRPRQLEIRTSGDGDDQVRLSVKDVGVGMEPQALERLFEPFYTTKREGMGIGLFVSHRIVDRHEGCLQAAANDGPGMTFSLTLPGIAGAGRPERSMAAART